MNSRKSQSQPLYDEEAPQFNSTMTLSEVESLFDHDIVELTEHERAEDMIQSELMRPSFDANGKSNFNISISASNIEKGPGKGFTG